ncbi:hypothetical protein A3709_08910 [Halioglobus sp. HI00S01]|uniref:hypothetical protein n=1 Tax=Halioglobus sp. HI00S01 TaxID=1822214 RepID=UPI0007C38DC4|nr:hypothetical protein [Halioglobus sp. HI00S01]KZX55099.1 hypothetical protein A3709_08910 [Halioglobus sp. HI00S01]
MKTDLLFTLAAAFGAAAILWMGFDFVGANGLALLVTGVIGFVYTLGQLELWRFRRDTASLTSALQTPPIDTELAPWLTQLPATLRNAVGQRIEGERVGLPAPVFSPYLVGLLVMLGLLGTFVGMVDTLQGAVIALEGSTELAAIRQGLAAPIEGLSLAFGTSVAGVAASAMLGLNATLSRRERMQATRQLDSLIAGELRHHSLNWHRQQTFIAMQQQAEALPRVADRLEAMAGELERMGNTLGDQLMGSQQQFLAGAEGQYQTLASDVGQSLRDSLADSGRLAGESIAPIIAQTLGKLVEHSESLHQQLNAANQKHLEQVQAELARSSGQVIDQLQETGTAMASHAGDTSTALVAKMGELLAGTEALVQQRAANESQWLEQQSARMNELTEALRGELSEFRATDRAHNAASLEQLGALQEATAARLAELQTQTAEQLSQLHSSAGKTMTSIDAQQREQAAQLHQTLEQSLTTLSATTSEHLSTLTETASGHLSNLTETTTGQLSALSSDTSEHLTKLSAGAADQLTRLTDETAEQLSALESTAASQLGNLTGEASTHLAALESTAANHLATLGQELEEPMTRLIETASETPRAAAEVIGKLHEEVANNLERDNTLLEERQQIMTDLAELTKTMEQSTTSQQAVIAELVTTTTNMLGEVSDSFRSSLSDEASKLSDLTVDVAGSAAEMASLGEAFGLAVQLYSESNTQLVENLSRIEESMEKSTERSDEQMSYYVAQAREIIDQSMLSQREIIEELRRLGQTGDLFADEATS